jgi:fructose-1,6-bisphosphatase/inositol monophosphatase family enzyme
VHESGKHGKIDKGVDDPVTIADLTAQKTIEDIYKHFFPALFV